MANVRTIACANEAIPSPDHPFTLFYRLNTAETWLVRGISSTESLENTMRNLMDATCNLPTRTILRTDTGSGEEVSIQDVVSLIEEDAVLGKGKLRNLYLVVYPRNPMPGPESIGRTEMRPVGEKSGCCALQ